MTISRKDWEAKIKELSQEIESLSKSESELSFILDSEIKGNRPAHILTVAVRNILRDSKKDDEGNIDQFKNLSASVAIKQIKNIDDPKNIVLKQQIEEELKIRKINKTTQTFLHEIYYRRMRNNYSEFYKLRIMVKLIQEISVRKIQLARCVEYLKQICSADVFLNDTIESKNSYCKSLLIKLKQEINSVGFVLEDSLNPVKLEEMARQNFESKSHDQEIITPYSFLLELSKQFGTPEQKMIAGMVLNPPGNSHTLQYLEKELTDSLDDVAKLKKEAEYLKKRNKEMYAEQGLFFLNRDGIAEKRMEILGKCAFPEQVISLFKMMHNNYLNKIEELVKQESEHCKQDTVDAGFAEMVMHFADSSIGKLTPTLESIENLKATARDEIAKESDNIIRTKIKMADVVKALDEFHSRQAKFNGKSLGCNAQRLSQYFSKINKDKIEKLFEPYILNQHSDVPIQTTLHDINSIEIEKDFKELSKQIELFSDNFELNIKEYGLLKAESRVIQKSIDNAKESQKNIVVSLYLKLLDHLLLRIKDIKAKVTYLDAQLAEIRQNLIDEPIYVLKTNAPIKIVDPRFNFNKLDRMSDSSFGLPKPKKPQLTVEVEDTPVDAFMRWLKI